MKRTVRRRGDAAITRLLGVSLALLLACSAAAQSDVGVGLTQVRLTTPLRAQFSAEPGEEASGSITIRNDGPQAVAVDLGQTDFRLDETGQILYEAAEGGGQSNRTWIEVASQVTVPAGASVQVPYLVEVPEGTEPGTYWSMVLVEPQDRTRFEDRGDGGDEVQTSVTINFRYGVVILVNVGSPEARRVEFVEPTFSEGPGGYLLSVKLRNPGSFLFAAEAWLELYSADGELATNVESTEVRIYPHSSLIQRFDLGELDPQSYQALVIVDAGGENVLGARYTLEVSAAEQPAD